MNTAELEYHKLTGYLVGTFTRQRYDKRRGCTITTTYEVVNLGRPERGTPVDPNEAIADDPWERQPYFDAALADNARKVYLEQLEARHRAVQLVLMAYLREHGKATVPKLAEVAGRPKPWLSVHLAKFEGAIYVRLPKGKRSNYWGLVGLHDKEANNAG